jgi:hypothetical protein
MSPSKQAKEVGFKSLSQVQKISGQSQQCLHNWSKNKPDLFKVVLLGAYQILQKEESLS